MPLRGNRERHRRTDNSRRRHGGQGEGLWLKACRRAVLIAQSLQVPAIEAMAVSGCGARCRSGCVALVAGLRTSRKSRTTVEAGGGKSQVSLVLPPMPRGFAAAAARCRLRRCSFPPALCNDGFARSVTATTTELHYQGQDPRQNSVSVECSSSLFCAPCMRRWPARGGRLRPFATACQQPCPAAAASVCSSSQRPPRPLLLRSLPLLALRLALVVALRPQPVGAEDCRQEGPDGGGLVWGRWAQRGARPRAVARLLPAPPRVYAAGREAGGQAGRHLHIKVLRPLPRSSAETHPLPL